jgi:hypothetical protein
MQWNDGSGSERPMGTISERALLGTLALIVLLLLAATAAAA